MAVPCVLPGTGQEGCWEGESRRVPSGFAVLQIDGYLLSCPHPLYCAEETVFPDCLYSGAVLSAGVNDTLLSPLTS